MISVKKVVKNGKRCWILVLLNFFDFTLNLRVNKTAISPNLNESNVCGRPVNTSSRIDVKLRKSRIGSNFLICLGGCNNKSNVPSLKIRTVP